MNWSKCESWGGLLIQGKRYISINLILNENECYQQQKQNKQLLICPTTQWGICTCNLKTKPNQAKNTPLTIIYSNTPPPQPSLSTANFFLRSHAGKLDWNIAPIIFVFGKYRRWWWWYMIRIWRNVLFIINHSDFIVPVVVIVAVLNVK